VAVARARYEDALEFAKTYTAGGPKPIIYYQYPGYVLGDVAAKIEAARYFCWKGAHYLDQHDYHGEMLGAMVKIHCTEMLFDCVYKCMQVVGVNSLDRKWQYERYLREAAVLPLYDAGNFGMQRRRVHGVMADGGFDPRGDGQQVRGLHQSHGGNRHDPGSDGRSAPACDCLMAALCRPRRGTASGTTGRHHVTSFATPARISPAGRLSGYARNPRTRQPPCLQDSC
jgi:hypothetical protein